MTGVYQRSGFLSSAPGCSNLRMLTIRIRRAELAMAAAFAAVFLLISVLLVSSLAC